MIEETALNLCCLANIGLSPENIRGFLRAYAAQTARLELPEAKRVYLGAEFCDRALLFEPQDALLTAARLLEQAGYRVTAVIPPLREQNWAGILARIEALLCCPAVDEAVANDFGVLFAFGERFPDWHGMLAAGRLFDRTVREGRFDALQNDGYRTHVRELTRPHAAEPALAAALRGLGVARVEVDTLPFGGAPVRAAEGFALSVHYPRVYLSRAGFCEFSGLGREKDGFSLETRCARQCASQYQVATGLGHPDFYKIGAAVFTYQDEPPEMLIDAPCRLVYSLF